MYVYSWLSIRIDMSTYHNMIDRVSYSYKALVDICE